MLIVGVDPGYQAGGVVVLGSAGRQVLGAWSWRIRKRKAGPVWGVTSSAGEVVVVAGLHAVAELVAALVGERDYLLVIEDLFGRGRTLQRLAESAGEVMGPLREGCHGCPVRVGASTWRPAVLGISPRTAADTAERFAVEWAQGLTGLDQLQTNPHVCEAAAIASWGLQRLGWAGSDDRRVV